MHPQFTTILAYRFWSNVRYTDHCWEWLGERMYKGYGTISWCHRTLRAHRVAWELAYGPIPDGKWVLHCCDNRLCVRPFHLFLGDNLANMRDCAAKGRRPRGETNPAARLRLQDVLAIRAAYTGEQGDVAALARQFGVSRSTVRRTALRKNWRHIT